MNRLIARLAVAVALVATASVASAQQVDCAQIKRNIEYYTWSWNFKGCPTRPPNTFECMLIRSQLTANHRLYNANCSGANRPARVDEDGFELDSFETE